MADALGRLLHPRSAVVISLLEELCQQIHYHDAFSCALLSLAMHAPCTAEPGGVEDPGATA
eukprot:5698562-Amphidinium_carterae.2